MSRSHKHNPGYSSPVRNLKLLARRRERHTSMDTIGYLSNPDGDPLVSKAKRGFARLYSSWDIHDGRYLVSREYEDRWLKELMEDEEDAIMWFGENWREVPYDRYLYEYWARCCYWK